MATTPIYDLTDTWDVTATTFTGIKLNATDTASNAASLLMDLQVGGASRFKVDKTGNVTALGDVNLGTTAAVDFGTTEILGGNNVIYISYGRSTKYAFSAGAFKLENTYVLGWTPTNNLANPADTILARDAANTLAQRNGANAQAFRIYNTFTDASNYERLTLTTQAGFVQLIAQQAGTGSTSLSMDIGTVASGGKIDFYTGAGAKWRITSAGHFVGITDNLYDIGASGTQRPRNLYLAGSAVSGGAVSALGFASTRDASIQFTNSNTPGGGTTSVALHSDAGTALAQRNGANAQESRIYGSYTSATNYQRMSVKTVREVTPALTSGSTYVSTIAIPAYAHLIGVTTRVNTAITGATTYSVGDGADADLWGASIPIAVDSESRTADFTDIAAVGPAATARTVTLTANGSDFTAGVVEICLHYLTTEAD